jgi:hypothetical protein
MDDVAAKVVRQWIVAQSLELGDRRRDLCSVLRPVLNVVVTESKVRRARVGFNGH